MKGYRIKVIRHGKTKAFDNSSYIGITNYPLSDEGIAELDEKMDIYNYGKIQKVYSSPLSRCVETAEMLFPNNQLHVVTEMGEMSFGDFEEKTPDMLKDLPEYKLWLQGGMDNAPPNGETLRQVLERVLEGLSFIIEDAMKNSLTNVAIVTHGGIIMNMLSCFGLPKMESSEFLCDFGEGFEIMVTAEMWQRSDAFEILGMYPYSRKDEQELYEENFDYYDDFKVDEDFEYDDLENYADDDEFDEYYEDEEV